MLDLNRALSTYGLVFLAELPDKTALVALWLASRYPAGRVFLGTASAFFLHSLIAAFLGARSAEFLLRDSSRAALTGFSGVILLFFGIKTAWEIVIQKDDKANANPTQIIPQHKQSSAFRAGFVSIFFLEFGDLTQITGILMAAESGKPFSVFVGSFLALVSVSAIAVFFGTKLKKFQSGKFQNQVKWVSAALFLAMGVFFLYRAI